MNCKKMILGISTALLVVSAAASTELTIYNQNFAVVRDDVSLDLAKGVNVVSFNEVTFLLEPESVVLRDPNNKVEFSVLEQSYRADPINQYTLLKKFEGKVITFLVNSDGKEKRIKGTVVRGDASGQSIIEVDGELRFGLPGIPLFPSLGNDAILKPSLDWKIGSKKRAQVDAQLSYITSGLSWKADYNMIVSNKGERMDLVAWVSMYNHSGRSFDDVGIKLLAGDVNKIAHKVRQQRMVPMIQEEDSFYDDGGVQERSLDEYHLYELPLRTTLRDKEKKQVEFARADNIHSAKLYEFEASNVRFNGSLMMNTDYGVYGNPKVAVKYAFENTKKNNLGIPFPKGQLRLYSRDVDGQLEFIGENVIDHTPKNETIKIKTGDAFDILGERKRIDFQSGKKWAKESFEITLKNKKDSVVIVDVIEQLYRWSNWTITSTGFDWEKQDAQSMHIKVKLKPGAEKTLRYTVRYSWK